MPFKTRLGVLIIILYLSPFCTHAQNYYGYHALINKANNIYGSNDLLHSGEIYYSAHLYAKGNPYFLTPNYLHISVVTHGHAFSNVTAQYNIELDRLVLLAPTDSNSVTWILLNQNMVDSFDIQDHHFVNIVKYDTTKTLKGYYELVYRGKRNFFMHYNKKFINTYNDVNPAGFYSVLHTTYYMDEGGKFIPVENKKAFLRTYSDNKKAIKKFIRKNKIRFSHASSKQLNKLMQFADALPDKN